MFAGLARLAHPKMKELYACSVIVFRNEKRKGLSQGWGN
jgi:hypothetical protein